VVEAAGEHALDAAAGFSFRLALVEFALEVRGCLGVVAATVERDRVQGPVRLPVAAAVEAVALDRAAGGFDRAGAGERGEGGF